MVDVQPNRNSITVTVSGTKGNNSVNVTNNEALFYAEKSREFAEQSRDYAFQSATSATLAQEQLSSVVSAGTDALDVISTLSTEKIEQIETLGNEAVSSIQNEKTIGTIALTNTKNEYMTSIRTQATESVGSVTSAGTSAITSINTSTTNALGSIATAKTSAVDELDTYVAQHHDELKGEKGDKGEQGIQGIQGIQGVKGDKGEQGIQGIQGIQGEKGDKGDKGEKGDKGDPGSIDNIQFADIKGNATDNTSLKTALDGKQATISDLSTIRTQASNSVQYNTVTNKGLYLATHPELSINSVVLPFIHNDISYLDKKGGTITYKRRTEDGEFGTYTQSTADNLVNGKPNYVHIDARNHYEYEITLELDKAYLYGNVVYIDFGQEKWRATYIKVEYRRKNENWNTYTTINNNNKSALYWGISGSSSGIEALRFTIRPFDNSSASSFRIAQIGLINYNGNGSQSTLLGLGGGTLYGDVTFANGGLTGYVKNTDYAGADKAGIIKASNTFNTTVTGSGYLSGVQRTLAQYNNDANGAIISKGTLENIKESLVTSVGDGKYAKTDELNNPFSLGDSKYSPNELNNISWLASNGQWNSGDVYVDFYNAYVSKIGQPFGAGYVKASTDTYTDYDLVINTSDRTFRLPLLDGSESLVSDRYDDFTLQSSGSFYTAPANGWFCLAKRSTATGQYIYMGANNGTAPSMTSASFNTTGYVQCSIPCRSGDSCQVSYSVAGEMAWFRFIYAKGNGTLYYYVGETVQNANLIDAGRIAEQLTNKVDIDSSWGFPSNRYIDLTLGASGTQYTAPANGWVTLYCKTNSADGEIRLWTSLISSNNRSYSRYATSIFLPVKKGEIFTASYDSLNQVYYFRFIYAEGSN